MIFKGYGSEKECDFEPLPLSPNESLKSSVDESQEVWENTQKDAAMKKRVGANDDTQACAPNLQEDDKKKVDENVASAAKYGRKAIEQGTTIPQSQEPVITKAEATQLATTLSKILSSCQEPRWHHKHATLIKNAKKPFWE